MTHRRPAPLRGREVELAELDRRVDLLARGAGGALVLEGASGSGKTRLLDEVAARALGAGLRVFTGAGQRSWQVLELLDGLPGAGGGGGAGALVRELHDSLERAALDVPVLVVLDDFQWADPAAAKAARVLVRRLAADPVLWLIARRPTPDDHLDAPVLRLGDLPADAVRDLALDVLGGLPDGPLTALLAGAQGNPLLVGELLNGLLDEAAVDVRDGVAALRTEAAPLRFRESVRSRVRQLSAPAREAVELAAILGRAFTAGQLARMLDRAPAALLGPLREVVDAELVVERGDRFGFRHDLVREAVEGGLPEPLRRDLRRQAVEASLAEGAPAADVAALVLRTATRGDQRSIALLRRAAAEIAPRSPVVAASLSTRALELVRPGEAKGPMLTDAVTQLVLAGEVDEASALFDRYAGAALAPATAARLRRLLAEVLLPADVARSAALCREALALPGLADDLRAQLHAVLATALVVAGERAEGRREAEAATAAAEGSPDPVLRSSVLITDAMTRFQRCDPAGALRAADAAIRARDAAPGARALWLPDGCKALLLAASGRLAEAWELTGTGVDLARADGQQANEWTWVVIRTALLLRAGRLDEARAEAESVRTLSEELGAAVFREFASSVLGQVALHRGELVEAGRAAERMRAVGLPSWRARGAVLGALVAEAGGGVGGLDAGVDDFYGGCADPVALDGPAEVAVLVRLLLRSGERERARALVARLEGERARHPGERGVRAAAWHARGVLEGDAGLLVRAAAEYEGDERALVRARVAEDAGVALAGVDRAAGVALLDSALELWTAAGADHDAGRVRGALRRHGVRRRAPDGPGAGWAGLTGSEARVARLVALGRTNRQVADELHLSPHTVSTHLRHAFAKLGIRTRTELARLAPEA
ncbi:MULTISPECIES: AAA family ATPase [Actinosynnema]|uniref:AAA family ATPase n=1 Tax=Actinosynnema TaxID=40566 RepID=UPI0020A41CA4|nr:AAA family ATPase [Actinosynnema pretiosum]MCP2092292.1 AAA ATPase domain-containing protein [Actinosynnema pretiosum]